MPAGPVKGESFEDYARVIADGWFWVAFGALLGLALGLGLGSTRPERYQATAVVLVAASPAERGIEGDTSTNQATRDLTNDVTLAESQAVASRLGSGVPSDGKIQIAAQSSSDVLNFTATAGDAQEAASYANSWADAFIAEKRETSAESYDQTTSELRTRLGQLRDERAALEATLEPLQDDLLDTQSALAAAQRRDPAAANLGSLQTATDRAQSELARATRLIEPEVQVIDAQLTAVADSIAELETARQVASTGGARVIEPATAPASPSTSSPLAMGLALAALGGLLGVVVTLLRARLDQRIREVGDLDAAGYEVLGAIPRAAKRDRSALELATINAPESAQAAGYQKVRTAAQFATVSGEIASIMVTSPNPSEGKTTTSCNLALTLALVGRRTALVDADFRRPRIAEVFSYPQSPGLADAILEDSDLASAAHGFGDISELAILTAGSSPPHPADFCASAPFAAAIAKLSAEADTVVVDAPPVLPVADALSVARCVDAVIVTVKAGKTTMGELEECVTSLERLGARVWGVVLVGCDHEAKYYGTYTATERSA